MRNEVIFLKPLTLLKRERDMRHYTILFLLIPSLSLGLAQRLHKQKMLVRKLIMERGFGHTKSGPGRNDDVQDLFPEIKIERNIYKLPSGGQ